MARSNSGSRLVSVGYRLPDLDDALTPSPAGSPRTPSGSSTTRARRSTSTPSRARSSTSPATSYNARRTSRSSPPQLNGPPGRNPLPHREPALVGAHTGDSSIGARGGHLPPGRATYDPDHGARAVHGGSEDGRVPHPATVHPASGSEAAHAPVPAGSTAAHSEHPSGTGGPDHGHHSNGSGGEEPGDGHGAEETSPDDEVLPLPTTGNLTFHAQRCCRVGRISRSINCASCEDMSIGTPRQSATPGSSTEVLLSATTLLRRTTTSMDPADVVHKEFSQLPIEIIRMLASAELTLRLTRRVSE
ncbi:hypothetical protein M2266_004004 [Streptomyces sp. SPB162]|nr:hypothetical protein [Streptomyces sp. SPB162]